jgi:hypothetical protein
MNNGKEQIQWTRKIPQKKIHQLYESDAKGLIDETLVDEVGYWLYARCESILTVTEAHYGRVKCPCCSNIILRENTYDENEIVRCDNCQWEIVWKDYKDTYRKKQLFGANAIEVFKQYIQDFPKGRTYRERVLIIDKLLHEFHTGITEYGRPVVANLVEGNLKEVIGFLNNLTYNTETNNVLMETQIKWRNKLNSTSWIKQIQ